jgi:hypothetical protein
MQDSRYQWKLTVDQRDACRNMTLKHYFAVQEFLKNQK